MRHVYIRGILALVWLAAAIAAGVSGNLEMVLLYCLLCGVFSFFAYAAWKKEKDRKGER